MERQVFCEHPRIIINPGLRDLVFKYLNVTIKGKTTRFNKLSLYLGSLPPQVLSPIKRKRTYSFDKKSFDVEEIVQISHDDLKDCYVTDFRTGEVFPVYLEVPCGHCDLCKDSKINAFVERCRFETQSHDAWPWFITLTYDDKHLPYDGVRVRDVQLFLKRLRINLERSGFPFRLRYVAVGEYGRNTKRPHYHLLLWGLYTYTPSDVQKVGSIIYNSWSNGYTLHRLVNPSDDKCFYYTAKYLKKDVQVPTFVGPDDNTYPCNPFSFSNLAEMAGLVDILLNV